MKITLQHFTPLVICSDAIRTCWDSGDKSDTREAQSIAREEAILEGNDYFFNSEHITGEKDRALIDRVGNKNKHSSTLEHLTYNFQVEGVSRALLQELARHRMASLSVKSTRYTLKELKDEEPFTDEDNYFNFEQKQRAYKYLVLVKSSYVNYCSVLALENVRRILVEGVSNDYAKYCLPESYKTEFTWTINARSLQNFLSLRSDKAALWEIRDLANAIFEALPLDHKYLFEGCMKNENV